MEEGEKPSKFYCHCCRGIQNIWFDELILQWRCIDCGNVVGVAK